MEAALREAPNAAVRFGFLFAGQPQSGLYVALRDGTPLPQKTKEELQAERRQRAKLLAARLNGGGSGHDAQGPTGEGARSDLPEQCP